MKGLKFLLILVMIFGISYSCSAPRPLGTLQGQAKVKEKLNTIIVRSVDTVFRESKFDFKEYLDSNLGSYRRDNLSLQSNLRFMMDSLSKVNEKLLQMNNLNAFNSLLLQQQSLSARERLLLEREKNSELKKETVYLERETKLKDNITSVFLTIGVLVNLLLTLVLYVYKRKQVKELKKLNLIHA